MSRTYTVGIDIGGTKVAVGLCDAQGNVLAERKEPTTDPAAVVSQVAALISDTDIQVSEIAGMGVGSVGPLDLDRGQILDPINLPTWNDVPIVELLSAEFDLPVYLDNDANVGALAEWKYGAQVQNLIYMTISTGIGGGIINHGSLVHGKGNAGEVGHMILLPSGPHCECGKRGCLEALASGTAIAKKGSDLLGRSVDAEDVVKMARGGHSLAAKIIDDAAYFLGLGISNLAEICDPEVVVLGGGVTQSWDMFQGLVDEVVDTHSRTPVGVQLTSFGSDIGIVGASLLPLLD